MMPPDFSPADLAAITLFLTAWCGYTLVMDHLAWGLWGVNQHLKLLRDEWMKRMLDRENRIMDTALVGHTIHSVTFFASTSMLVLAGLVGLLGAVDAAHGMLSQFSFASPVSREFFELKILLLFGIFIFGFMKFTWAIRQYNYCCAMIGSAPMPPLDPADRDAYAEEVGDILSLAGRQLQRRPARLLLRAGGPGLVHRSLCVQFRDPVGGHDPDPPPVRLPHLPRNAPSRGKAARAAEKLSRPDRLHAVSPRRRPDGLRRARRRLLPAGLVIPEARYFLKNASAPLR
jgi:uncharacterized membrane protein